MSALLDFLESCLPKVTNPALAAPVAVYRLGALMTLSQSPLR